MADEDKRPFVGLENAGKFWASVVAFVEDKVLARFTDAEKTKLAGIDMSTKLDVSEKGSANGVAELDANGLLLSSQLPSYVDDVLEYANRSAFPATGEAGKIYVALDTNLTYRWAGSSYTEISPSLALGETSSTAYRGDRGKAAYDHAQAHGSAFSSDLYKITTNAEGHVTAATPATSADIVAFLNNQAITPSSVTATGAVKGSSVSDSVGSLADLRDSVSQKKGLSSLASLDDLPPNGFGLVESIASDIRPDTVVTAALYLSFGEGQNRAVVFLRFGQTQAWVNTRNNTGWHGWKSLV